MSVAVKVQIVRSREDERDTHRESSIHCFVSGSRVVLKDGQEFDGADVCPRFGISGTLDIRGCRVRVTVMARVSATAVSLFNLVKTNGPDVLDAKLYASLERKLVTLWMLGVTHADAHASNVLIRDRHTSTGSVKQEATLVDFGMALYLGESGADRTRRLWKQMLKRQDVSPPSETAEAGRRNGAGTLVDRTLKTYSPRFGEIHWDGMLLRRVREAFRLDQRHIWKARRKLSVRSSRKNAKRATTSQRKPM
jgi:hypothetical protein